MKNYDPQKPHKRESSTRQVRLPPLDLDKLQWAKACLKHILPDIKISDTVVMRRALAHYVSQLGSIVSAHKDRFRLVQGEAAHLLDANQNKPAPWENEVFPEGRLLDEQGNFIRWDLLEKQARDEKRKKELADLFSGASNGEKKRGSPV